MKFHTAWSRIVKRGGGGEFRNALSQFADNEKLKVNASLLSERRKVNFKGGSYRSWRIF